MAHLDVYPMPGGARRGHVVDVMLTQAFAAVPCRELRELAGSLQDQRETVLRALDLLLTGA